jgi:predicted GNAT family N-acyltransferase
MTIQHIDFATPAFDEALALRNDILRVPLDLEFETKDILTEWDSHHMGLYDQYQTLQACLTLLPLNKQEVKMRQVAVAQAQQGKGLGKTLVVASESFSKTCKFKKIVLHARKSAVPFYKKLGYKVLGKMFKEVGIPHFKMYKNL